jgi:uncharacterized protein
MNKYITILRNHKTALFNKYPIQSLALFGSQARGDNKPGSDVDIMVELKEPDPISFIELSYELEMLLQTHVDLVSKGGIKKNYLNFFESQLIYV